MLENQTESQRKRPRQARARATVEAVLEATSQVLIEYGYARLTTTRVAKRAGVSVGTLYQYFSGKAAPHCTSGQLSIVGVAGDLA